ncbi:MAG: DNA-binding NtrC family response regulator [Thermoproteota archaeon]|jgi:DNA-binding NtrC family response regulator
MSLKILLIEDDQYFRKVISLKLSKYGQVLEADTIEKAKKLLTSYKFDVAFIDLNLTDTSNLDGLEVVEICKAKEILNIVLTSNDSKDIILEAYKSGCSHYFTKFDFEENLDTRVGGLLKGLKGESFEKFFNEEFITQDENLKTKIKYIKDMTLDEDHKVLITGPTGVGKTLLAKQIHLITEGNSSDANFIHVNLSELSENLIESELFGHVKGSFTGASTDKEGLFSKAAGGTLFLDEIGAIPLRIQKKLLKVIEEKTFYKVGSSKLEKSNFRLITATCDDLAKLIKNEQFRLDLYFRIKGYEIEIPGLAYRKEDIILLIDFFIAKSPKKIALDPKAEKLLKQYEWSGNIRELQNLVRELTSLNKGFINSTDLPLYVQKNESPLEMQDENKSLLGSDLYDYCEEFGLPALIKKIESDIMLKTIKTSNGKVNEIGRKLKISKSVLYRIQKDLKGDQYVQ